MVAGVIALYYLDEYDGVCQRDADQEQDCR